MTGPAATCVHHFVLEQPSGPAINGQCKKCRMKRTWPASHDRDLPWNDKTGTAKGAAASVAARKAKKVTQ